MLEVVREYFTFLKERKKLVLLPILVFLALLSILAIFTSVVTLSPFIYSLF